MLKKKFLNFEFEENNAEKFLYLYLYNHYFLNLKFLYTINYTDIEKKKAVIMKGFDE